jgi:hypothetical protein
LTQVLNTTTWFLWVAAVLFAGGWLNWKDLPEHFWGAKWLIKTIGNAPARLIYLLIGSVIGSLTILDLFQAW